MRLRPTSPRSLAILVFAGAAMLLTAVPSALAATAPGVAATQYTANGTVSWSPSTPDLGATITGYEGNLSGAAFSVPATQTSVTLPVAPGTYTLTVHANQDFLGVPSSGPDAVGTVVVDATPPTLTVALNPAAPNGENGWYRSLTIVWSCDAAGGAPVISCPANAAPPARGAGLTVSGVATDAAGNATAPVVSPAFNFDNAAPQAPPLQAPTPRATVTSEPTFVWGAPGGTETSGFNRFEVYVRISGTYRLVAVVPYVAGQTEYRATRDPSRWPTVLPKGVSTNWYVRTVDTAGNGGGGTGQARAFTINPNAPGKPALTGGPRGLTNTASPTFSWTGDQPGFSWQLFAAGNDTALQGATGAATQATVPGLTDGDYTFRVSQVNAYGQEGDEAVQTFTVDTTPPGAPPITGRPPYPTNNPTPTFTWATEPGASSRWQVLGPGGNVLQQSDTPGTTATVGALANGAYVFRVTQIDAAGNASPATSDPFSIAGVAPPPAKTASLTSLLPLQNASRLRPRAGRTLVTRTPVLQWTKGPRGTTVYNVQLFKVIRKRPNLPPVVTKVYSAFPKGTQFRVPKSKTRPGTCYIWRVWPYTGRTFTKAPLGISNFCIASSKALAKAAKAGAKKRK